MKIGVAGLGFMGAVHLAAWEQVPDATVVAVMSSDQVKLSGDLRSVGGNLGVAGRCFDFSGVQILTSFDELVAIHDLDVLDICLPSHLHADASIRALTTGKHVFVEKPLALTGSDAEHVLRTAEASGRLLMCGHVLRFFEEYRWLAERLPTSGRMHSAFFRRRAAAPAWSAWLTDKDKSGGAILDMLVHDVDFCLSLWGMPRSVRCRGHEELSRGIDVCHINLDYPGLGPVEITGGWHHPKHYPFSMEFTVVTDEATYDWKSGGVPTSYPAAGEPIAPTLQGIDPFAAELKYFANCVVSGKQPSECPPAESVMAIQLVESIRESRNRGGEPIVCRS